MKNYADRGGCYPSRLKAEVDNITSSEFNNYFILFLSKNYTTTRSTIVWGLLCLLVMVFDTGILKKQLKFLLDKLWLCGWPHSPCNNQVNSTSITDHWKDALPSKGEGKNPHLYSQVHTARTRVGERGKRQDLLLPVMSSPSKTTRDR